ncbi:hypothetical protein L1887_22722 [Cichorium endivia]|nr:hypothetical protein L1887_22722 [Cichorium endivia]
MASVASLMQEEDGVDGEAMKRRYDVDEGEEVGVERKEAVTGGESKKSNGGAVMDGTKTQIRDASTDRKIKAKRGGSKPDFKDP